MPVGHPYMFLGWSSPSFSRSPFVWSGTHECINNMSVMCYRIKLQFSTWFCKTVKKHTHSSDSYECAHSYLLQTQYPGCDWVAVGTSLLGERLYYLEKSIIGKEATKDIAWEKSQIRVISILSWTSDKDLPWTLSIITIIMFCILSATM